jgi:hypothetical protein
MSILPSKYVGETITVTWNFLGQIPFGQTISTPVVTISLYSGDDPSISGMALGSPSVSGADVTQKVQSGNPGAIYRLRCTVTASGGAILTETHLLAVLSNFGGTTLPFPELSLTGDLPDGFYGVPYSSHLDIAGGIQPYVTIHNIAGTSPPWLISGIAGNQVTYSGIPNTLGTITFTPEVIDFAGFRATDPQVINITATPVVVSGDLVNGVVGQIVNYTYTISGGVPPYVVTISAGALPVGTSMSTVGVVTGQYINAGISSWTVRAVDSIGQIGTLNDTNTVSVTTMLMMVNIGGANVAVIPSTTGTDWSAAIIASGGNVNNAPYITGIPNRCWGRGVAAAVPASYSDNLGVNWTLTGANVIASTYGNSRGDAVANGRLLLPAHTGNYLYSDDNGATFSTGTFAGRFIVALNSAKNNIAAFNGSVCRMSTDRGDNWNVGFTVSNFTTTSGGCSGSDLVSYYWGAQNPVGSVPKLIKASPGDVAETIVPLPTLTGATYVNSFAFGNGVKVIGTDNGKIAYDNGSGFVDSGTTLPNGVRQIFWTGTHFLAISQPIGAGNGQVYYSANGQTPWTAAPMTPRQIYSIGFARLV